MSKIFYDHLVDYSELEKLIKKHVKTEEARHEIYGLIDEIIHHKVVGCILDRLPQEHHKEFLNHVKERAHDESLISYLGEHIAEDVEEFIRHEIHMLGTELLEMFADQDEKLQRGNLH